VTDVGDKKGIDLSNDEYKKITEQIIGKLGIHPDIEVEDVKGSDLKILRISVGRSNLPISLEGTYYKRVGNTTREMKSEELQEFFRKDTSWDSIVNDCSIKDIDEKSVELFVKMARKIQRVKIFDSDTPVEDILRSLKLMNGEKLTNAALVLFGRDPQLNFVNAALRVVRIKSENIIIGDDTIEGNIIRQFGAGEESIKKFMNVHYKIESMQRKEVWDYPVPAIREAVLNALVHRDYFKWNVQTQIKIFDDRIWFYNPGELPAGMTLEELKKVHPSVPRNPLIVHVMYLSGLIEELGSGIKRMETSMKEAGLPVPVFKEEFDGFSVYLRKDLYSIERLRAMGLNERQMKIVSAMKEKAEITLSDTRKIFDRVTEKTLYRDLQELVSKGILEQFGEKKGRTYRLN